MMNLDPPCESMTSSASEVLPDMKLLIFARSSLSMEENRDCSDCFEVRDSCGYIFTDFVFVPTKPTPRELEAVATTCVPDRDRPSLLAVYAGQRRGANEAPPSSVAAGRGDCVCA